MHTHVKLSAENKLVVLGGSPDGRDEVHEIVTSWAGWRRAPGKAILDGGAEVSKYWAEPTPTALLAPLQCKVLAVNYSPEALELARRWEKKLARFKSALANDTPFLPQAHFPTERRPMAHQASALQAIEALDYRVLLADDMGLGKTATALWAAHAAGARKLLVVCPVSVKWNWRSEIEKTLGDLWGVTIIDGSARKRSDQMVELVNYLEKNSSPQALIINYDLLAAMLETDHLANFALHAFHVYDESHYLKSVAADRTKIATGLANLADQILLLSGTPICNFVSDIYSQVQILRPGTWVSYHDFCKRHLDMRLAPNRKTMIPVRSKRLVNLNAIVNTVQIARKKNDCISLPPKIHTYPQLQMDQNMRTVYQAMKEWAKIELGHLISSAGKDANIWDPSVRTGARNVMMRCEQIAAGFLGGVPESVSDEVDPSAMLEAMGPVIQRQAEKIPGRPGELIFPQFAKIVWLVEAIESVLTQGGRPVIFSRFNGPLFWLQTKLKNSVFLHGGLENELKHDAVRNFQDGKIQVFLCQVRMAQGFNLTASQDVLFYGRDWAPAVNAQAEDRCHRIGQTGTVQIQVPIVRGTVEIYLDKKLAMKETDSSSALASTTLGELLEAL